MGEYVGFDVSKEATAFCVMEGARKNMARGKVASDPAPHADHRRAVPLAAREGRRSGTAASQGFRTAHGFETGRMATDVPHRRATRSWPKALGNSLYESLSTLLGIGSGKSGMPTRLSLGEGRVDWGSNRRMHRLRSTGAMGAARWEGGPGNRGRPVPVGARASNAVASTAGRAGVGRGRTAYEAG